MFISDRAIEHLEKTAQAVGFGRRDDYPFQGKAAVSAGDWKGCSIASCVFADADQAHEYWEKVQGELGALGSDVQFQTIPISNDIADYGCIAVITAIDLVHRDETAPDSSVK